MERIPSTPSPASTYCSACVGSQHSPVRRSQRLIDKEIRNSQKIPPKSCSPQLFGNDEDYYTELPLQQDKPTAKVVHLQPADKVVHLRSSDEIVHQKSSDKIIHLKNDINKQGRNKNDNQDPDPPKTSQRKRSRPATPKKRVRKPKQPAKEKPQKDYPGISPSSSKLPSQYPAHFVHQLPPSEELNSSSDALDFGEDTHIPDIPSETESDFSVNISLSDSIGEIFGTKDVCSILKVQRPRKYILLEDHLPALATMLDVNLERLRNALEITQRLTHEQILRLPVKQEVEDIEELQTNLV
ncbi:meiotic recombination protein P22 [Drosophila takahashii]|uniref:meiotic recombination protein P22 n=1 Tax=Drosophila takahashii TaxID=29030 RepID=UPI001CF9031E|nr:meiotic recombination protein P22 [Drosophila takahashii]